MGTAQLATAEIRRPFGTKLPRAVVLVAVAVVGAALLGMVVADQPRWYRIGFAVAIASNLLIAAVRWPRAAVAATLLFLPFLAFLRRLLIADAGWTSYDPLLLVAPAVAAFLFYRAFALERRSLTDDTLSKLVLAFVALAVVQTLNPISGGIVAGMGGFMFLGVPLLWFFIGREYADRQIVTWLMYAIVGLAVAIGAYGLMQTEVGLPSWDQSWVNLNVDGFLGLEILGKLRSFGTFSSASEYALFLGIGLVISVAMLLHGRGSFILALPFLAVCMFLASGRSVLAMSVLTACLMVGFRARRVGLGVLLAILGLAITVVVAGNYANPDSGTYRSSQDPLVGHQVAGLANPLDPEKSTLPVHLDLLSIGVNEGISRPLGHGTGATNLAASRFGIGSATRGTEIDVSNAFVSLGIVGGFLFIAIIIVAFRRAISAYLTRPEPALLAALGLMVVTVGGWLNGGHYAVAPLLWFVVGWATKQEARASAEP